MAKERKGEGFDPLMAELLNVTKGEAAKLTAESKKKKSKSEASIQKQDKEPPKEEPKTVDIKQEEKSIIDTPVVNEVPTVPPIEEPAQDIIHEEQPKVQEPVKKQTKPEIKSIEFDDYFSEDQGEYFGSLAADINDRDFIRLIARFERCNINVLSDNISQAWLSHHLKYFENNGIASLLEIKEKFLQPGIEDDPFSDSIKVSDRVTTLRLSPQTAQSFHFIATITKYTVHKQFTYAVHWWKNEYKEKLKKKKYYPFIKKYI